MNGMKRGLPVLACLALAACGTPKVPNTPTNAATTVFKGGLIPATNIAVSPTVTLSLEKILYWGGVAAIAYYVVDPQAPNWDIQEAKFPDEHYKLSLKMKRYYGGGAGEARVVFNRRAQELANTSGYSGYRILEYSEGLESNVIGSQRTSEGVIVLTGLVKPPVTPKAEVPKAEAPATAIPVPNFSAVTTLPPTLALAEGQTPPASQNQAKPKAKAKPKKRKDCL